MVYEYITIIQKKCKVIKTNKLIEFDRRETDKLTDSHPIATNSKMSLKEIKNSLG